MPEFRLHLDSPRSTPAEATSSSISSPAPRFLLKLSIPRQFLLCSIRQRILVLQPYFPSHLAWPMPSTHHRGPAGSDRARCILREPRPGKCEAPPHLSSGNHGSAQNRSECVASNARTWQENVPYLANSFGRNQLAVCKLH